MDMTPGRAIFNPDEIFKPLRDPKSVVRPEGQTTSVGQQQQATRRLSASASEFVPRTNVVGGSVSSIQERLHRHQQQYIAETYHNVYQQQPQQQQQQQFNNQQSYANGYGQQQQPQQQQLMTQMNSIYISNGGGSVQDRLNMSNNSRGSGASGSNGGNTSGNSTFYPQYNQNQTSHHRNYNKHNHNNHHNNHQHAAYNNHHNYQQQQQQHQQQQPQNRHNHYQNQQQNYPEPTQEADDEVTVADDVQNAALDYLQTVIQCLNQNPGQFDSIATRFITIFHGLENDHFVLSIAMEDIFKEAIKNPNFRYMGAKLYNLLHTLNPQRDSLFHSLLKSKLDFHQQDMIRYMEKQQENKVRETALFLAELYMQLRGDDSRIILIAENIVYSLKQLLQHVTNDNIRCICLTLKLAGYDLFSDCPDETMFIINNLEEIISENPGKYPMASNVVALQKNNWGRNASGSADSEAALPPPEPPRASDEPVFYGPDGREITAEESEFLSNSAVGVSYNGGGSTDNDEDDLGELDSEMDEETEKAYKQFLKQQSNLS